MKTGRRYRVIVERDESGAWIARVPAVRGCHTYGRSLGEVRRRIREALGLWANAESAELILDVRLPAGAREALRRGRNARSRAARTQGEAQERLAEAVLALKRAGLSLRDAAELLDLSHQRIQQMGRAG